MANDDLVERLVITQEWFDAEQVVPAWLKGVLFLGYREQGWVASQNGKTVATGAWGDEIIRLRDGVIACTLYPSGYCTRAAVAVGSLLAENATLRADNATLRADNAALVEGIAEIEEAGMMWTTCENVPAMARALIAQRGEKNDG